VMLFVSIPMSAPATIPQNVKSYCKQCTKSKPHFVFEKWATRRNNCVLSEQIYDKINGFKGFDSGTLQLRPLENI
jgi:ribosomal protein L44E